MVGPIRRTTSCSPSFHHEPSISGSERSTYENHHFYTEEEENILVAFSDKAKCYAWMYQKAHNTFWWIHTLFMIPIIIFSAFVGTANFAQNRFHGRAAQVAPMVIGGMSIFVSILSTLLQFFKIGEVLEGSRQAVLYWSKFARLIEFELANPPQKRKPARMFIENASAEFDRLSEISPAIPNKVLRRFIELFQHESELVVPEIAGRISHTKKWEPPESKEKVRVDIDGEVVITDTTTSVEQLDLYRKSFYLRHGRNPTDEEMASRRL